MRVAPRALASGFLLLFAAFSAAAVRSSAIQDVSVSKSFFNPTAGQNVGFAFAVAQPGTLTVRVLDSDGFVVRELVTKQETKAGTVVLTWDGRDGRGRIVPDEAYSLKIDLVGQGGTDAYFPASSPAKDVSVQPGNYDRRTAILSYDLPTPSRVLVQAGTGRIDPKTKKLDGPILKTIANWKPRSGGSVLEYWNGLDESGTIRVTDIPNFGIWIEAQALPENSVITVGDRRTASKDGTGRRTGRSLLEPPKRANSRANLHQPVPKLTVKPQNATWSPTERLWMSSEKDLKVGVSVTSPSAVSLAGQPGRLQIFLDQRPVREVRFLSSRLDLGIPLGEVPPGNHVVAFNWLGDSGLVAVNSFRLRTRRPASVSIVSER